MGGAGGGKSGISVFCGEPVVGGNDLDVGGDNSRVVCNKLVGDGLLVGGRVGKVIHVPVKFVEQSGKFAGQIFVAGGGG